MFSPRYVSKAPEELRVILDEYRSTTSKSDAGAPWEENSSRLEDSQSELPEERK
jgi:hypothetical protein